MRKASRFRAAQVRNTVLLSFKTREIVFRGIKKKFRELEEDDPQRQELINGCLNMGLIPEADELISLT